MLHLSSSSSSSSWMLGWRWAVFSGLYERRGKKVESFGANGEFFVWLIGFSFAFAFACWSHALARVFCVKRSARHQLSIVRHQLSFVRSRSLVGWLVSERASLFFQSAAACVVGLIMIDSLFVVVVVRVVAVVVWCERAKCDDNNEIPAATAKFEQSTALTVHHWQQSIIDLLSPFNSLLFFAAAALGLDFWEKSRNKNKVVSAHTTLSQWTRDKQQQQHTHAIHWKLHRSVYDNKTCARFHLPSMRANKMKIKKSPNKTFSFLAANTEKKREAKEWSSKINAHTASASACASAACVNCVRAWPTLARTTFASICLPSIMHQQQQPIYLLSLSKHSLQSLTRHKRDYILQ